MVDCFKRVGAREIGKSVLIELCQSPLEKRLTDDGNEHMKNQIG